MRTSRLVRTIGVLMGILFLLGTAGQAKAVSYSFDYLGFSWGTMEITMFDADTLQVRFDVASSPPFPEDGEVTGFAFYFEVLPISVGNPLAGDFPGDRDDLHWVNMTNLNAIPQPTNIPGIDKSDFNYAVALHGTNFGPPTPPPAPPAPGFGPGEFDIFFLNFTGVDFNEVEDLFEFVPLAGIRIQSLPDDINTGSVFLATPLPGAVWLLGSGLLGLVAFGRRRRLR